MKDKRYSYVTCIMTDDYLIGVLALQRSLQLVGAHYGLVVTVSDNVSVAAESIISNFGMETIRVGKLPIPDNLQQDKKHWLNCLGKLAVFSLTDFDKLIYVDSDMMVMRNIDHLFDSPHMAATQAGRAFPGNEGWTGLNGGLMVIVPKPGLRQELESCIPHVVGTVKDLGDQDIYQYYYRWPQSEDLVLSEAYNMLIIYLDYYLRNKILRRKDIYILHFIGANKPWMKSAGGQIRHVAACVKRGKIYEAWYFARYLALIYRVKLKMHILNIRMHR